jgi:hypothetical protein
MIHESARDRDCVSCEESPAAGPLVNGLKREFCVKTSPVHPIVATTLPR